MVWFKKLLDVIESLTEYVLFVLVGSMVAIVFAQVIFRFVFHASLPWSEEASRYIMVWLSMLGASVGLRRKGHIGVEALVLLFSPSLKRKVEIATAVFTGAFFVGIIYYGLKLFSVVVNQESPAMGISMGVPYSALIVGGVLMLMSSIEECARLILCSGGEASK